MEKSIKPAQCCIHHKKSLAFLVNKNLFDLHSLAKYLKENQKQAFQKPFIFLKSLYQMVRFKNSKTPPSKEIIDISIHLTYEILKSNLSIKERAVSILEKIVKNYNFNEFISKLESAKDHLVFKMLAYLVRNQKEVPEEKIHEFIVTRMLVDQSTEPNSHCKIDFLISPYIYPEFFEKKMLDLCINLINRSEDNVKLFEDLFLHLSFKISFQSAKEFINVLKDIIISKSENNQKIAQKIVIDILTHLDLQSLKNLLSIIEENVNNTSQDLVRVTWLRLGLIGVTKRKDIKSSNLAILFNMITKNVTYLQDTEFLHHLVLILQNLERCTIICDSEPKECDAIKSGISDLMTKTQNLKKDIFLIGYAMISVLEKMYHTENLNEFEESLCSSFYKTYIVPHYKNSNKFNSTVLQALCNLHLILKGLFKKDEDFISNYKEDTEVLALLFLNSKNTLSSRFVLENLSKYEVKLLFESLLKIRTLPELNEIIDSYEGVRENFENILSLAMLNSHLELDVIRKYLLSIVETQDIPMIIDHILMGLIGVSEFMPELLKKQVSRIQSILITILTRFTNEKNSKLFSYDLWKNLLYICSLPILNQRRYPFANVIINLINKSPILFDALQEIVTDNSASIIEYIVSNKGLFSEKVDLGLIFANIALILLKATKFHLFAHLQTFLNLNHLTSDEELNQFDEADEELTKERDKMLENHKDSYCNMGYIEEAKTQKNIAKPQGKPIKGKQQAQKIKTTKADILDEEELEELKNMKIKQRLFRICTGIARLVCLYLKNSLKYNKLENEKQLLKNVIPSIEMLIEKNCDIRAALFVSFIKAIETITKRFMKKYEIFSQLFLKMVINSEFDDLDSLKILGCFESLNSYEIERFSEDELQLIIKSPFLVIDSNIVDTSWKKEALGFVFRVLLCKKFCNDVSEKTYKILSKNINLLSCFNESVELFTRSLELVDTSKRQLLIHDIFTFYDSGRFIALKSLSNLKTIISLSIEDKLNLKVLMIDDNNEHKILAAEIWELNNYIIKVEEINGMDLQKYITQCDTIDTIEKLCEVLGSFCISNIQNCAKLIDQAIKVCKNMFQLNLKGKIPAEKLTFFPKFFIQIYAHLNTEQVQEILINIIEYCERPDQELFSDDCLILGREILKAYGEKHFEKLLGIIEKYLGPTQSKEVKVSPFIFLGLLGKYMKDSSKFSQLQFKIITLFAKSTENHQKVLSKFMIDLLIFFTDPKKTLSKLLEEIQYETEENVLQGKIYCLVGIVKGLGIKVLEENGIISYIEKIANEKVSKKEGPSLQAKLTILFFINALTECLGKLFEPYFGHLLNYILAYQSDNNANVSKLCSKVLSNTMNNLSSYGIKKILPTILEGCQSYNFKTKLSSIHSLGSMAHSASKQISACLPLIVPKLSEAMSDTSTEMKIAAKKALENIGQTIKSPEIGEICPILIRAISNPYEENKNGLLSLLKTQFCHYIDAPALSIILPIINYGLKSRDTLLKQMAAQVVGSVSALIKDNKDLDPYLEKLIESLLTSLKDVMSEVRNMTAKALGSLAKKLGARYCPKFVACLTKILSSADTTTVERSGAAQGFAEVLTSQGFEYVEKMLPELFMLTQEKRDYIRESYLGLFVYLPILLIGHYHDYVSQTLANVVESISHNNENIRSLALRVVKIIIQNYSKSHESELIRPLMGGLFSENEKTRYSSIVLLEDLVTTLTSSYSSEGRSFMLEHKNVFAAIYVVKFDSDINVRTNGNNLWKLLVDNTPRVLKLIASDVFETLSMISGSESYDVQEIFANCLKNFAQKYFDVLHEPIFAAVHTLVNDQKMDSTYKYKLIIGLGKCLQEIVHTIDDKIITTRLSEFKNCLIDYIYIESPEASKSVVQYYATLIWKLNKTDVLDEIISNLMTKLNNINSLDPNYEFYLHIIQNILEPGYKIIIKYMEALIFEPTFREWQIDTITRSPKPLSTLLYKKDSKILSHGGKTLLDSIISFKNEFEKDSLKYGVLCLGSKLEDEELQLFIKDIINLLSGASINNTDKVILGLQCMKFMYDNCGKLIQEQYKPTFTCVSRFFTIPNEKIKNELNLLLQVVYTHFDEEFCFEMISHLQATFQNIPLEKIELFTIEDSLVPFYSIIESCMKNGNEDMCCNAADVAFELVNKSSIEAQEYVIKDLVGLHLRMIYYEHSVKTRRKIIENLTLFLDKSESLQMFEFQIFYTVTRILNQDKALMETKNREVMIQLFSKYGNISTNETFFVRSFKVFILKSLDHYLPLLAAYAGERIKNLSAEQKSKFKAFIKKEINIQEVNILMEKLEQLI